MSNPPSPFNGINGSNGAYLLGDKTSREIAGLARNVPVEPDPGHLSTLRKWWRRFNPDKARGDQEFNVRHGIDSRDLAQAGWGVIFPFVGDEAGKREQAAILDALRPLLDLRKSQAGRVKESYYREIAGTSGYRPGDANTPAETKRQFLVRFGAAPGSPADPEALPYYLMIVADPETIPYRFQYQIDVEYAVGRLHFDTVEEYAHYARSVVEAETGTVARPRKAAFFGARNPDDPATRLSADDLIDPLATNLDPKVNLKLDPADRWEMPRFLAEKATKGQLGRLLGGEETPSLLMTAGHGMGFDRDDPKQLAHQGALLCQEWDGPLRTPPNRPIDERCYFSADDVKDHARLNGLIAFFFACYGAGTPKLDDFPDLAIGRQDQIAPHTFLARLPRRMLGHPKGGALAVIGHVDRAWGYSFQWPGAGKQLGCFEDMLTQLFEGYPIGAATEALNQRYAALSVELSDGLAEEKFGKVLDDDTLAGLWISNNDARSYIIIGDPAVRVCGSYTPVAAAVPANGSGPLATPPAERVPNRPEAPPVASAPAAPEAAILPARLPAGEDPLAGFPTVGMMTPSVAAARLRSMGEIKIAESIEAASAAAPAPPSDTAPVAYSFISRLLGRPLEAWEYTAHAFGFLAPGRVGQDPLPIRHASNIDADPSLKGASIKITLDDMRVAAYPGGGLHRVLIDFSAQNQAAGQVENLHFNATFRVQEGQQAGFMGQPIFVGLNLGDEGITFRCYTVNVKNDDDQAFLDLLESDTLKSGLKLLSAVQPALGPLASMATGLTKTIAGRNQNVPVQDIVLGLDFSTIPMRARLAEGSYIAVQIPDAGLVTWNWDEWIYLPSAGRIVSKADTTRPIPYNYLVFSVSRHQPSGPKPAGG